MPRCERHRKNELACRWIVMPLAAMLLISLLLIGPAADAQETQALVPVEGQTVAAQLVGLGRSAEPEGQDQATFAVDGHTRQIALDDLVRWGTPAQVSRGPQVLLAGGGLLVGDPLERVTIDADHLMVISDIFGEMKIPLDRVAGIVFQAPPNARESELLRDRITRTKRTSDWVRLDNGDELRGAIVALGEETAQWEINQRPLSLSVKKIAALAFDSALLAKPRGPGPRSIVAFRDGSQLVVTGTMTRGTAVRDAIVQLKILGGLAVEVRLDKIVAIQPLGRRVTYLSDLQPLSYKHVPYLALSWPYKIDRNVSGSALRADGKRYLKGLGMHSASRLTYRLDATYRRLSALLAIDDHAEGAGSVVFRVYLHDGKQWRQTYRSDVVRGGDPPRPISVDVTGAKAVSLLVDFADRGDERDHANWLDARLIK